MPLFFMPYFIATADLSHNATADLQIRGIDTDSLSIFRISKVTNPEIRDSKVELIEIC